MKRLANEAVGTERRPKGRKTIMFTKLGKMVAVVTLSAGLAVGLTSAGCTDDSGNPPPNTDGHVSDAKGTGGSNGDGGGTDGVAADGPGADAAGTDAGDDGAATDGATDAPAVD